ncbi:hypothetical protein ACIO93_10955 [Streptomyces sp. NPDC087903]|uniref:hypothetical protein n=1 Tax=Streptomyces sp. NPDC087903 TaxID=3365819 RepID=UPI003809AE14
MDQDERDVLSRVCEELPALRDEISGHSEEKARLLARIEAEAAARRPILPLLAELLGTGRDETRQALGAGLPGAGAGRADEEWFACPDGACDRVATTVPAGPVPVCSVTRRTMRRQ